MKSHILFPLFFVALQAVSQEVNIKWGPTYKTEGGGLFAQYLSSKFFMGHNATHFFMLNKVKKEYTLQKFDWNCNMVSETELDPRADGEELTA
ncbi:MAG: hypothetical protein NZM35_00170 [Chitinophagales bacterium]|nr:hypothetical protein [Chitinophagales bacterium]MDW8417861.1 hypothetical protein [Chitinophagales bacterium]